MNEHLTKFSRNGLLIGAILIATEYLLFHLFYANADPDLWDERVPHKYIFYIEFVLVVMIFALVQLRQGLKEEISNNAKSFSDINLNIGRMFGFTIFAAGTYIVYHVLKARLLNEQVIFEFVDNNLYVRSQANPFAIINLVVYPIIQVFSYQGFLLNGLTSHFGYRTSTILTSLFYGYWFDDPIGGTAANLFFNAVYFESKNIFYPIVLAILINLVYAVAYLIAPEFWLLKAQAGEYNDELMKGLIFAIVGMPVVIPFLVKLLKR
jgi:membrane protease YdiL (CAAX protease family)